MKVILRISLLAALVVPPVSAQHIDVPIRNWSVPPYTLASAGGGITTMTDVTSPRVFVAVAPCRLADTRGIDGFSGQAGGPALTSFANRNFELAGGPIGVPAPPAGCPAGTVPSVADAVSVQFTIVFPSSAGNLVAWNAGGATPNVSVLNWDAGTVALGSGTIVPLSFDRKITVRLNTAAAGQTAHLIIDVNGYFSETPANSSNGLIFGNNSNSPSLYVENVSTSCTGGCGISAHTLGGNAIQADSLGIGVTYGVWGDVQSVSNNAAGVRGTNGPPFSFPATYLAAGVRGEGPTWGVLGIGQVQGVTGSLVQGAEVAHGILGFDAGAVNYGVFYHNGLGGTGAKNFVEPHPTDSTKVIRYISLEGNEPGTYFRGKSRFQRGMARIAVPEDFRMVTDAEGITVQITPIGPMTTFSVVKYDLNEIVVQASRNVEFFYMVNGIRRTHKHLTSPIGEGREYMPHSAEATMPVYFTDEQKQLLIRNGTYNSDGTVNMETARRNGWDRIWEERAQPTPVESRN